MGRTITLFLEAAGVVALLTLEQRWRKRRGSGRKGRPWLRYMAPLAFVAGVFLLPISAAATGRSTDLASAPLAIAVAVFNFFLFLSAYRLWTAGERDTDERTVVEGSEPAQARGRFVRVPKGYDPDQVQDFLIQIGDRVELLEAELRQAREEVETFSRHDGPPREEGSRELADRMALMLRLADRHAEKVRRASEQDANLLRAEAQAEADGIRGDAETDAEGIRNRARAEADRAVREARSTAERLRRENDEQISRTREEAGRIVTILLSRRDELQKEVEDIRERLRAVFEIAKGSPPSPP